MFGKKSFWVKSAFFLGNLALEGSLGSLFERRPAELQLWPQLCYQRQMGKENVILEKAWKRPSLPVIKGKEELTGKTWKEVLSFPSWQTWQLRPQVSFPVLLQTTFGVSATSPFSFLRTFLRSTQGFFTSLFGGHTEYYGSIFIRKSP